MFFRSNFGALELQIVQYIYIQRGREIFTASEAIASDAVVFWGLQKGAAMRPHGLPLLVSLYALVIDYAAPVQTERKVVDISVGVAVAADVARTVFAMLLHSLH